jgi:hypothetical protein
MDENKYAEEVVYPAFKFMFKVAVFVVIYCCLVTIWKNL